MTKAATQERTEVAAAGTGKGELVHIAPPRLPYHPSIEDRFGVDKSGWRVLVEATFPSAKSVEAIIMALSYCQARKLDIFKRVVHIVPMWSTKLNGYVETVWPGIAELRTTAFRTGQYAGCDEAAFGPVVEKTFAGRVKEKDGWKDKEITVQFPEWCRITVWRVVPGIGKCAFVGPKVKWQETYATIGASDLPNDMWQTRTEGQLEKCAEAAALRKAFPEELGNQLTAEEMEGRRINEPGANAKDVTPAQDAKPVNLADALDKLAEVSASDTPSIDGKAHELPLEDADGPVTDDADATATNTDRHTKKTAPKTSDVPDPSNEPEAFLKFLDQKLATFKDFAAMSSYWEENIEPLVKAMFPPDQKEVHKLWSKHERRLGA